MKLSIERITKEYGQKRALDNVSCELTEGLYGFLGANGSGKTTLMRILASVSRPSSGRVLLDGVDISLMNEGYRDLLGYLPQHMGLYKNFTVHKFLLYIAALKGLEKGHAERKIDELLDVVQLAEEKRTKTGKLSGGMKQRVGIAQALLNDPKILIVDEPTAGLDPKERIRFRNLLQTMATDRIVLLSTHIVSDIEYVAKEILVMKKGTLIQKAEPHVLLGGLQEKVWTIEASPSEVGALQARHRLSSLVKAGDRISVRILSELKPDERAVAATPDLEDLYLYYFDEEAPK
ncbi:ABC transporter ATP-binding protein [Paenibacillus harenae]|uniref:ABC-type multidrug transport system ATPase subunit n=1 Tax=Paenibacillus harenae TaxID=306543 RepID=A0ABT9UBD1_PAEHA|nr:ABC transporter ATP-binding protein [Paenibacillus harenae]MDQ0115769.1 ABC-type multidrug transport system ATPase subunit [Paenibacillus harenae]